MKKMHLGVVCVCREGERMVAESDNRGNYYNYIYELGSFRPIAQIKGEHQTSHIFYAHLDAIGTPLYWIEHHGCPVWSAYYSSYGNVLAQKNNAAHCPLRFQGQYFDAETGLHYNRNRYYSPTQGRYITPDPIGLAGGLNQYQYTRNPLGWVDPLGLADFKGNGCPKKNNSDGGGDELGRGEGLGAPGVEGNTTVGRWMSPNELEEMKKTGKVQEGGGGLTFVSTSGASSFRKEAKAGSVYVEFDVSDKNLIQGGKKDWLKTLGPNAPKSQLFLLNKKGGTVNPPFTNLSEIIETK